MSIKNKKTMAKKYQQEEIVQGVMDFLEDENEEELLSEISNNLIEIEEKNRRENTAYLKSFTEVSAEQLKMIKDRLEELTKHQIIIRKEIDKTLLGGFKIILGDWVYDASIYSQLMLLKDQLYESN